MSLTKTISPLDGRYRKKIHHLTDYFSEFALMRMRSLIELQYLEALNTTQLFPKLTDEELERIHVVKHNFSTIDYERIKDIEKKIQHDVKACEVFLIERLQLKNENLIHFGLTSEDVNNLSYTLLFKEFLEQEHIPLLSELIFIMSELAEEWKSLPFPARTHGQKASPTTAGKEIAVFISRVLRQFKRLKQLRFMGKLNGATGTFSALVTAFPEFDWLYFSFHFIDRLGLLPNIATTQIEDHDNWAEMFSIIRQINNIVLDLDRDIWMYLTLGYMKVLSEKETVGSSTMPHKVNPINFENSEGNLGISNSLLGFLIDKLTQSRMQRDLSDSTVTRNVGVALSHSYLALKETIRGLKKLQLNEQRCREELENSPELLAEPIQILLKLEGLSDPYSLVKDAFRGKSISQEDINSFIDKLEITKETKDKIKSLNVTEYLGLSETICDIVLEDARSEIRKEDVL